MMPNTPPLVSAIYAFMDYLKAKNSSQHTLRNYAIDLTTFKAFLEHDLPPERQSAKIDPYLSEKDNRCVPESVQLHTITRTTLRDFLGALVHQKRARSTMARHLSSLRSFFLFCEQRSWIKENPMTTIKNPKIEKRLPRSLAYEEVERLLNQPDLESCLGLRDRSIMELFYSSALRVSELAMLNRAHFDPDELLLTLRGKGKKERVVPITANAAAWIMRYLNSPKRYLNPTERHQGTEAIFLNSRGTRLTTRSIDRLFARYLIQSGLGGRITPHTIRHTIATHWLENGMELKTIQLLLGHSSLSTTTIYTQISTKLKRAAFDQAHPRAQ